MTSTLVTSDHSQIHKPYLYLLGMILFCFLGYAFMTVQYIFNYHMIPWMDIITAIILLTAVYWIATVRSTYELGEKEITVTMSSLFRRRVMKIPYTVIDGVHYYKVEPIKTIAYKHTYRMYGNLDKRDVYSMVYNIPHTDKVSRILMKASPEFWTSFEKLLPGKIGIPQEKVLEAAFRHISGAGDMK